MAPSTVNGAGSREIGTLDLGPWALDLRFSPPDHPGPSLLPIADCRSPLCLLAGLFFWAACASSPYQDARSFPCSAPPACVLCRRPTLLPRPPQLQASSSHLQVPLGLPLPLTGAVGTANIALRRPPAHRARTARLDSRVFDREAKPALRSELAATGGGQSSLIETRSTANLPYLPCAVKLPTSSDHSCSVRISQSTPACEFGFAPLHRNAAACCASCLERAYTARERKSSTGTGTIDIPCSSHHRHLPT